MSFCAQSVRRAALAAVAAMGCFAAAPAVAQEGSDGFTVWIEAEDADQNRMFRHSWYGNADEEKLSGGDWVSHYQSGQRGLAMYRFEAPGGKARFLLRVNPVQNELHYQLNGGEWTPVPFHRATDRTNIAADGNLDIRFLAWVDAGEVELREGANRIVFRTQSEQHDQNPGAIDAFVFTTDNGYKPTGTLKPGEEGATVPSGTQDAWRFEPGYDQLADDALLDLRNLNEDVAGETGFVQLSEDGNDFVRGDGQPLRFWAINDYEFSDLDLEPLKEHAEFLAKRGINMARWHGQIVNREDGASLDSINEQALDQLHKYVAAFKESGIYLTVSPYYPHAVGETPESWGVPVDSEGMTGLIYFVPELQEAYKAWLKQMLEKENPYTGIPLKDEPAVALISMQNEDSLLFHTLSTIRGKEAEMLADRFGQFLKDKYGSLPRARQAWDDVGPLGPLAEIEDNWQTGRIALSHLWHLTQPIDPRSPRARRLADQTEFLTVIMRDWHEEVARYLKEDLGSEHLFNPGNWRTADNLLLDDHERYSYAIDGAVVGLNRYTNSLHTGENRGWAIVKGDLYTNESVLKNPGKLQVAVKQPEGHPFVFPEALWVPPMWYQAEGPWLTAAYSSLNGADTVYWFSNSEPQWRQAGSANGYLDSIGKWVLATPGHLGMFPAASIIYRNGYLEEGEPVVVERRPPQELWRRIAPLISFEGAYDPNRDNIAPAGSNAAGKRAAVSRDAFLIGPVRVLYETGSDEVADIDEHVDGDVVRSNTSQLAWDKSTGYATMNAPKAQGAAGFLADAGKLELTDVSIQYNPPEHADSELSKNSGYAAVSVVPLDDQPIAASNKVLVQVGTVARPTGWAVEETTTDDGQSAYRVQEHGGAPWAIEKATNLTIEVANAELTKATILDPNGMPAGEIELERQGDRVSFAFPEDALYVVLE